YTIGDYLAHEIQTPHIDTNNPAFEQAEKLVKDKIAKLFAIQGTRSVDDFHKELGLIMWNNVGMGRRKEDLEKAIELIPKLREEFWKNVRVTGQPDQFNQEIEKALRVADFMEMGELMARDALNRNESCGGHFREEYQTPEGEALRDDENYAYVAAWQYEGFGQVPSLHKEPLVFENVKLAQRNYKE
ncbi:MAG: fumarate reductase/succinate dehydrogenase flavoprotein subunit, partial [Mucinivorans sp.]